MDDELEGYCQNGHYHDNNGYLYEENWTKVMDQMDFQQLVSMEINMMRIIKVTEIVLQ